MTILFVNVSICATSFDIALLADHDSFARPYSEHSFSQSSEDRWGRKEKEGLNANVFLASCQIDRRTFEVAAVSERTTVFETFIL